MGDGNLSKPLSNYENETLEEQHSKLQCSLSVGRSLLKEEVEKCGGSIAASWQCPGPQSPTDCYPTHRFFPPDILPKLSAIPVFL